MSSTGDNGKVRYNYRLRLSAGARELLLAEWDRCRWVWNRCVETSNAAHRQSVETGVNAECGPALLDRRLTGWRGEHEWLAAGSSVAQQQTIRDFGRARVKALKDRKDKIMPVRRRRGMPRFKSKHRAAPTLNYTLRGFILDGRRVRLAGGIVVRPVWSRELPGAPSSVRIYRDPLDRWWCSFVVPAPEPESLSITGQSIGIDWGVTELATTTSDVHNLAHPQHGKRAAQQLTRYQRMMARRKLDQGLCRVARLQGGETWRGQTARPCRGPTLRHRPQVGQDSGD